MDNHKYKNNKKPQKVKDKEKEDEEDEDKEDDKEDDEDEDKEKEEDDENEEKEDEPKETSPKKLTKKEEQILKRQRKARKITREQFEKEMGIYEPEKTPLNQEEMKRPSRRKNTRTGSSVLGPKKVLSIRNRRI